MEDDFLNNELIERFEQMLDNREQVYFEPDDLYEIISFYLDVGDSEYSKKALSYAFTLYPDHTDFKVKQIEYFLSLTQLKKAAELIQELKGLTSEDLDYLLVVARYWGIKGMPKKAIEFYKLALDLDDDEKDFIYNCIANEYLNLNEVSLALYHFKQALLFNSENDYSFYSIIQCYSELHAVKDSIQFLQQFIDENPYAEAAWAQLGVQYLGIGDYTNALEAFDYVTVINPGSIAGHTQKGLCLERLKRYAEAISVYEEALALDDSAAYTYLRIGKCYTKLEKFSKALKAFHQSIKDDPQLDKAWVAAANLYEKLGNYDEAIFYLDRAIELDSTNTNYWKQHAYLQIKLGKLDAAAEAYTTLVQLEPLNFYNWIGLIETYIQLEKYEDGVNASLKALNHFNRAELYYQLSNCYLLLKQEQEGKEAFQQAVELDESLKIEMLEKYPILQQKMED